MRNIFFAGMLLACASASAQDVLITQNGDVMNVYDVDVGSNSVFYKSEDKATAPMLRISKSDVIMIKRKDGTKYDLGNEVQTNMQQTSSAQQPVTTAKPTISEASRKRNEEIISHANTFNPNYALDDTKKSASKLFCIMGAGENSQFVNDDLEVECILGPMLDVQGIKSIDAILSNGGKFNSDVKVSESWEGGFCNPSFQMKLKNKTNKTLYVDLGNTFISRNEVATPYYVPSSTSSSNSSSSGASVNLGAVAGALGVGGAIGTLAGGVAVGGGSSSGSVNTTYSQRIIAIPPMSVKICDAQLLFPQAGKFCDGLYIYWPNRLTIPMFSFKKNENGKYMNGETHDFSESTSPVKIGFYVTYSDNEACQNSKNLSFSYYFRRMIGFSGSSLDGHNTSINIKKAIPENSKCMGFVGKIISNAVFGVLKRGDK